MSFFRWVLGGGQRRGASSLVLHGERLDLRLPRADDFGEWMRLRRDSRNFLQPWEPRWPRDHLSPRSFRRRVRWARAEADAGRSLSLLIFAHGPHRMVGGITLSNIRRGPSRSGTLGYWVGREHARKGYMRGAIGIVMDHAFGEMALTRLEAACLEENVASRSLLLACGFGFEGIARSYLEVDGAVRDHMLFARVKGEDRAAPEPSGQAPVA